MPEESPDYYLREPSRGLAWNEMEVMVKQPVRGLATR
jgi:hypothetical protein